MKKTVLCIVAAILVLAFVGCDGAPAVETIVETTAPAGETTVPAVETTAPAVETTAPAVETTAPAVETTAPAVETTAPAATEEKKNPLVINTQPIDYDTTSTMGREFFVEVIGGKEPYAYQWVKITTDGEYALEDAKDGVEGSKTDILFLSPTEEGESQFKCYIIDADGNKVQTRVATLKYTKGANPAAPNPEAMFEIGSVDGIYERNVYSPEEVLTLKVKVENNGDVLPDYQWFRCDENGNTVEGGMPLSMGEKLEITGIPYEEMMIPRYYRASAMIGNTVKSVVFKVMLVPMGIEVEPTV